jgi:hypothetical protein
MLRKENKSTSSPTEGKRMARVDRAGGADDRQSESSSRLSSAILRILIGSRGATEGRRLVTPADLAPPPSRGHSGDGATKASEEERHDGETSARVEWTLRMMQ